MTFLSEILQFAVLIPCRHSRHSSFEKQAAVFCCENCGADGSGAGIPDPFLRMDRDNNGNSRKLYTFSGNGGTVSVLPQGVYGARKRGSAHISV